MLSEDKSHRSGHSIMTVVQSSSDKKVKENKKEEKKDDKKEDKKEKKEKKEKESKKEKKEKTRKMRSPSIFSSSSPTESKARTVEDTKSSFLKVKLCDLSILSLTMPVTATLAETKSMIAKKAKGVDINLFSLYEYQGDKLLRELTDPNETLSKVMDNWIFSNIHSFDYNITFKLRPGATLPAQTTPPTSNSSYPPVVHGDNPSLKREPSTASIIQQGVPPPTNGRESSEKAFSHSNSLQNQFERSDSGRSTSSNDDPSNRNSYGEFNNNSPHSNSLGHNTLVQSSSFSEIEGGYGTSIPTTTDDAAIYEQLDSHFLEFEALMFTSFNNIKEQQRKSMWSSPDSSFASSLGEEIAQFEKEKQELVEERKRIEEEREKLKQQEDEKKLNEDREEKMRRESELSSKEEEERRRKEAAEKKRQTMLLKLEEDKKRARAEEEEREREREIEKEGRELQMQEELRRAEEARRIEEDELRKQMKREEKERIRKAAEAAEAARLAEEAKAAEEAAEARAAEEAAREAALLEQKRKDEEQRQRQLEEERQRIKMEQQEKERLEAIEVARRMEEAQIREREEEEERIRMEEEKAKEASISFDSFNDDDFSKQLDSMIEDFGEAMDSNETESAEDEVNRLTESIFGNSEPQISFQDEVKKEDVSDSTKTEPSATAVNFASRDTEGRFKARPFSVQSLKPEPMSPPVRRPSESEDVISSKSTVEQRPGFNRPLPPNQRPPQTPPQNQQPQSPQTVRLQPPRPQPTLPSPQQNQQPPSPQQTRPNVPSGLRPQPTPASSQQNQQSQPSPLKTSAESIQLRQPPQPQQQPQVILQSPPQTRLPPSQNQPGRPQPQNPSQPEFPPKQTSTSPFPLKQTVPASPPVKQTDSRFAKPPPPSQVQKTTDSAPSLVAQPKPANNEAIESKQPSPRLPLKTEPQPGLPNVSPMLKNPAMKLVSEQPRAGTPIPFRPESQSPKPAEPIQKIPVKSSLSPTLPQTTPDASVKVSQQPIRPFNGAPLKSSEVPVKSNIPPTKTSEFPVKANHIAPSLLKQSESPVKPALVPSKSSESPVKVTLVPSKSSEAPVKNSFEFPVKVALVPSKSSESPVKASLDPSKSSSPPVKASVAPTPETPSKVSQNLIKNTTPPVKSNVAAPPSNASSPVKQSIPTNQNPNPNPNPNPKSPPLKQSSLPIKQNETPVKNSLPPNPQQNAAPVKNTNLPVKTAGEPQGIPTKQNVQSPQLGPGSSQNKLPLKQSNPPQGVPANQSQPGTRPLGTGAAPANNNTGPLVKQSGRPLPAVKTETPKDKPTCDRCDQAALEFCEDCEIFLCTECNSMLHMKGKWASHKRHNV
eukprot:TRINITY_DN351_c1_g2_i2.p1 TRINITY_DN351_c1_g2~~TRINITY_DN351_c1_g2_i2.p1  ORF type:complete len:1335 (-),score=457.49 TRINITY_DN351_c1_g2_i2:142-4146(-)